MACDAAMTELPAATCSMKILRLVFFIEMPYLVNVGDQIMP